ncbi:MAG TPA: bifunctional phosphopantothenoylcysteine decarboxylase/phosphopantothenate--cysteine ligase CoaBC [Acidimicrobiales bacterium]|nr:bifunctional phosphopantothenoylcysteine decarboxylase/phosphopantothenate--cysteine ligase CoaBC [Acidimicrobiales bacterium]
MTPPAGRRIVLGICGGIAAYKVVEVCRQLVDGGAHVTPVMTHDAARFVGEATFSALASERVQSSLWCEHDPIPHTALARRADVVVVAPATANFLARYAAGITDDLLTATLLATRAPVIVCPAMHTEMWEHPAVQDNVATLRARGVQIVGPASGHLAGGDEGAGRLVEPDAILAAVEATLMPHDLTGRKLLVTAGGTREPMDAVRFIGNRSSGKQGYALAAEAAARGAKVTLVTTVDRRVAAPIDIVRVQTAAEMADAVSERSQQADAVIMAAAVADFRPQFAASGKMTKADGPPALVLEPTADILAQLGQEKRPGQVLVGFAAEAGSDELASRAEAKLRQKNLDIIVANDVTMAGAGFDTDTNRAMIIRADGTNQEVPLVDKRELARRVIDAVASQLSESVRRKS